MLYYTTGELLRLDIDIHRITCTHQQPHENMLCNPRAVKRHCRFHVSWWHVSVTATRNPTRRRLRKLVIILIVTSCIVVEFTSDQHIGRLSRPSIESFIDDRFATSGCRACLVKQAKERGGDLHSIRVVAMLMLMQ